MDYESVTDLPGIGQVYGSRLNQAGYRSAEDVYEKFKSYNFDSDRCKGWLNSVCGANSRYASMCYESLRESHEQIDERSYSPCQQRYQPYRNETPDFGHLQLSCQPKPKPIRIQSPIYGLELRAPRQQQFTEKSLFTPVQQLPERRLYTPVQQLHERSPYTTEQQLPERSMYTPVQQSTASCKGSDISKTEVMQIMAEFTKKQDAMATQINHLEQEKSKTDNYIKTLETKIELMNKKAAEVQQRQDAKIATLTNKLSVMDRTEQYKNISSSIYLLSQKFDDILTELNEVKEKSTIHCYVKALEGRNKVSSSINLLSRKFDDMIKQQSESKQDKSSTHEAKIEQGERDQTETKESNETKTERPISDKQPIGIPNVQKRHANRNKTIDHLYVAERRWTVDFEDAVNDQGPTLYILHEKSMTRDFFFVLAVVLHLFSSDIIGDLFLGYNCK